MTNGTSGGGGKCNSSTAVQETRSKMSEAVKTNEITTQRVLKNFKQA